MHSRTLLLGVPLMAALAGDALAQDSRTYTIQPGARAYSFSFGEEDSDRAVVGIYTSTGTARDTLGILVTSVTAGGPADKAGIEEGARIASINGVNLRLAAADVGDEYMSGALSRRFTREMAKVKAGDEVELRVYAGGQTRTVRVKTITAAELNRETRRVSRDRDDRAALGVSLGSMGSKRDTLGVLISGLDDDGPAAKAGLEEGNRIQAINGVDVRVSREDAGDGFMSGSMVRRLQREMEKVKVGDEVALRVYQGGGRTRDVRVKTVAMSDLSRRSGMIFGTPMVAPVPSVRAMPPIELRRQLEEGLRDGELRSLIERAAPAAVRVMGSRIVM